MSLHNRRKGSFANQVSPKARLPKGHEPPDLQLLNSQSSQQVIQKNPDAKISLSKSDREPTLPEKMDIVNKWFASRATNGKSFKQAEVEIELIAELLVEKQLVSDRDTGIKFIMKSLGIREQDKDMSLNYAQFQRIFCRSVFKESLIEVLRVIEEGVYRNKKSIAAQPSMKLGSGATMTSNKAIGTS